MKIICELNVSFANAHSLKLTHRISVAHNGLNSHVPVLPVSTVKRPLIAAVRADYEINRVGECYFINIFAPNSLSCLV